MNTINFFGKSLNAFKANLHTHTKNSDGASLPQEIIDSYANAGYDVLALTDHRTTNRVSELDHRGMTVLSGIEMHPDGPRGIKWHILAVGVPENFAYNDSDDVQKMIDDANACGAAVFCAHPYWCAFSSADVATLKNILGIEVYNTSCRKIGREYNMQCWDELLDSGNFNYTAIAVDDTHCESHKFKGFTVIAAEDKTPRSLLNALKSGSFYSSQGPLFKSITVENNILKAEFTEVTTAIVMRRGAGGNCFAIPDSDGPGTGCTPVTSLELDLTKYPKNCARIQLCDENGRMAWSNPIIT